MALTKVNRGGLNTGIADSSNATFLTATSAEGVTLAGTLAVTGVHTVGTNAVATSEGGAVTTNVVQGLCKTWINFNGTTGSIATRDSFNVTSISDDGSAIYTVVIANDMASVNYALTLVGDDSGSRENIYCFAEAYAVGSFQLRSLNDQSSYIDCEVIGCTVQGDLA